MNNPISFIIVVASISVAFWQRPAAGLAFSNSPLKSTRKQYSYRNAPASARSALSRWPNDGHINGFNQRIRLPQLQFSKFTDNFMEEEPIIKSPPTDGSPNTNGAGIENNGSGGINGNTNEVEQSNIDKTSNERAIGILVLMTVPLAWGTYTPVVKYMYDRMDPSMPGFVFSAGYYLVAATTLGILSYLQDGSKDETVENGQLSDQIMSVNDDELQSDEDITSRGGLELGGYLFIGNGLQIVGLQTVPADRAGKRIHELRCVIFSAALLIFLCLHVVLFSIFGPAYHCHGTSHICINRREVISRATSDMDCMYSSVYWCHYHGGR